MPIGEWPCPGDVRQGHDCSLEGRISTTLDTHTQRPELMLRLLLSGLTQSIFTHACDKGTIP